MSMTVSQLVPLFLIFFQPRVDRHFFSVSSVFTSMFTDTRMFIYIAGATVLGLVKSCIGTKFTSQFGDLIAVSTLISQVNLYCAQVLTPFHVALLGFGY